MIIRIDRYFPYGYVLNESSEPARNVICGQLTTLAALIPGDDGVYELWPVCTAHGAEGWTWDGNEPLFAVGNAAEAGYAVS